jgi:cell division protein FtsL
MSAWYGVAAQVRPARPRGAPPRLRAAAPPAPERRVFGGVVWIGTVAVLLAGIVALNVAVLRLNMRLDELGGERANLRAENAALAARFSSSHATARIQALARTELGLVPAEPGETTYIQLVRGR